MESRSAFGRSELWGYSPAIDVVSTLHKINKNTESIENIHVLSIGSCDARHVLTSLCHSKRYKNQFLNFHLWEDSMIGMARIVLFVAVAVDFDTIIEERVNFLLEIYGNTLLRSKTLKYLQNIAISLVKFITETVDKTDGIMIELSKLFDISQLKYKNRDELESIFKFWMKYDPKNNDTIDMAGKRESRLREHYKERFDFRKNLIDWDYVWNICGIASIIHKIQYTEWRETGIAFQIRDSTYDQPNITLLTYVKGFKKLNDSNSNISSNLQQSMDPCLVQGYWSDIINSPYFGFGIKSKNQNLFKISSQQHIKTAVDVSEYNIKALLLELQFGTPVNHSIASNLSKNDTDDKKSDELASNSTNEDRSESKTNDICVDGSKTETVEEKSIEPINNENVGITENNNNNNYNQNREYPIKIILMPLEIVKHLSKKKYKNKFNCVMIGAFYLHFAASWLYSTLKLPKIQKTNDDGDKNKENTENIDNVTDLQSYIIAESPKYVVQLRCDETKTYIEKAKKRIGSLKMKCLFEPDASTLQLDPPKGGLSMDTYQIKNDETLDAYMAFST